MLRVKRIKNFVEIVLLERKLFKVKLFKKKNQAKFYYFFNYETYPEKDLKASIEWH